MGRNRKMWTGFWTLILTVGGCYAAIVLVFYWAQPRLLYYPELPGRAIDSRPDSIGLPYEEVAIQTEDGVRLAGWFLPGRQGRGALLFFHGNAGNISHRLDSLRIFHQLGLSVLIVDYRGYGQSTGTISEQGLYRDAEAAWRYLTENRRFASRDIVVFGRSLGAAVAAGLAARQAPGALIVESGFTSVPDLATELYPFLPVRWLCRFRYDTREFLRDARCPVLVVHSRDDEIIPWRHGHRLYEAAAGPKQFLEIRGGHNEGFLVSGTHYTTGLEGFLSMYLWQ
ncbi:MAG: lysophospholipase [Deltaproteobacteria bacterium RIFOXYD12_FULL_57_12]|nr:MAG: lysophospholipase [Deltaproteobacteria bacterium RIFOXYD12_FULL_57_12]